MEKTEYIAALHREARAFAKVMQANTQPPLPIVPACPAWNTLDLLLHLGSVQRMVAKIVTQHLQERPTFDSEFVEYVALSPQYLGWLMHTQPTPDAELLPAELIDWFEAGAARLEAAFVQVEPGEPLWTWDTANQTAAHWLRVQASEAAVHRWDAQDAYHCIEPIEPELALDAINFTFDVLLPKNRIDAKAPAGQGETFHFHRTDGPGEWLLRFEPSGAVVVERSHAKGDVAIRGSASDLLLWLRQRLYYSSDVQDRLQVFGEVALLERYFELVPPT